MAKYLDYTGLQQYTEIVRQKLSELSGRGRYLSNWNCKKGIPVSQPAIEDGESYEYKPGDYFIVSDSFYPDAGKPESIVITQTYGESLSDLEVNLNTWKENNPDIDIIQDIVYTDVEITQTQTAEGDTSVLSIGNPTLFEQRYDEIEQSCRDETSQQGLTFISFNGLSIEWYKESHSTGGVNYTICLRVMGKYTANDGTSEKTYVLDEGEDSRIRANTADEAKSELLSQYGLKLDGNLIFNEPYRPHSVYITKSNEVVGGRWTYLGQPVEDNNVETAFGVTYTGTPVINDVIRLDHKTSTLNFKPNGLSYLKTTPPTPSETIETEIVKENDTYLFDGNVWILLSNTAKEVNFETLEGSPYDNEALAEALDSKLDNSSEAEKVYGTDNNGEQVVYSAGNNIEFYNKVPEVFPGAGGVSYTEVGSLKSEDGQYIDTNLGYNSDQKGPTYDITFRYISIEGGDYYNGAVFGARAIAGNWGIGIDSYGGKVRIVHGGEKIYNVINKDTDTNWHRVYSTYDPNVDGGTTYYYYDDELVFQTTKQFTTSRLTMVVFGKRSEDSVSVNSPIEIASFKWYDDSGNALLDYVPAVSSTGEVGFYDKVSSELKVSATGTSPEVVPYTEEHKINAILPVKDVKVVDSSVVDEEGVAQLGSMAGESVENYMTSAEVESALALKQDIIQYSEVPEASEELLGKIIQYTGETTSEYTNGFFYKCIVEEESEAEDIYSWTNINIQDDNGGIANGVENQNPAQYKVNPIYDWIGTLEQYTEQDIETLHPEWVCYITNDGSSTSGGGSGSGFDPENIGEEGNVLTRTATGYAWTENSGGSGKTEDENGNLYISDEFAKDGEDNQYPLIYRTKSVDDSNVIKINAPVEIEEFDGKSRSLKVSGDLTAKNTKVKSLTIDGTVRAHGNIWMGRTSLKHEEIIYISDESGNTFRQIGETGVSYQWVDNNDPNIYVYTANYWPNIDENIYNDEQLTEQFDVVVNVWSEQVGEEWDSSRASIKDVKSISFHNDANGIIDNVYKIRGQNWNIEGNGNVELKDAKGDGWKIVGGSIEGKKIRLSSSGNEMGSLQVNGAIRVQGESTVTGTSHIKGDIKLDPKDSGNGYSRIYPTENETSSLGTPNHRFAKIYVKDIDISGSGGVDIAHLDGVEEINEDTLKFTKVANLSNGYYNEDGQYIGDTVTQYINTEDDLPVIKTGFLTDTGSTYRFGATINGISAWYNVVNNNDYVYTDTEEITFGTLVYADKECEEVITTISRVNKESSVTSIMGGFNYDGEIEEVSEIGVTPPDCANIIISDPGNRLLGKDIVYSYYGIPGGGQGEYRSYRTYRNESATASDWSDGIQRRYVWIYDDYIPEPGKQVAFICDSSDDPTVNALTFGSDIPYVSSAVRFPAQCLKGAENKEYIKTFISSGYGISGFWLRKDSNGNSIYGWTTDSNNPRVGDKIYEATSSGEKLSNVIDTVSKVIIPANSVAISSDTGTATVHNYTQKHFNFYQPVLQDVEGEDSRVMFEYSGYFGQDWTRYPPVSENWNAQRVRLSVNSYPSNVAYVDNWESTFAINQSFVIYNESYFKRILQVQPNTDYIIISKSDSVDTDIKIDFYYSDGTLASSTENNLTSEGKCDYFGFQLVGVTTVDENTSIMVRFGANANVVQYSLNANDDSPVYQNTTLIDKSDLVWAFYADSYNGNSSDCLFCMAGSTTTGSVDGGSVAYRYEYFINSVEQTGSWTTRKIRNPQVGDTLYIYWGNAPINIQPFATNRPVVKARTLVKAHRWRNSSNGLEYTFERNPGTDSHYWHHDMWGGIYSPVDWRVIGNVVPASISGIYYLNSTSQYVYYNGNNFQECFYHSETQDNVYSDIKLNNFYYWRALDGSYTFIDGKEHEVVATKDDLPRPDIITIAESGQDNTFFIRSPEDDTGNAIAWKKYEDTLIRYTDGNIFVNHVGDIIYANSELSAEIGTILNIAYQNEVIKFNRRDYELDIGNSSANSYYCWTNSDTGEQIYTRTPNPEVNDTVYWDIEFTTEAGSITEIVSGEPKAGTFYEVETIPSSESGRYFWNGSIFVEAEKLYKSITLYGEDNNLGRTRNPWNNVYAKSIESPYGTVSTRNGYLEVNGGKITNVTMINYNGVDYIYTNVNVVNRITITRSEDDFLLKPVELGLNYCKWQSETDSSIIYYTPDTNVNEEDELYLDKECKEKSNFIIGNVIETPTQVFTWTSTSGNVVYSLIRQLLEDDEIYDNNLCIRKANPMLITSSQFTDIFQESIIMNNNSITLVLRDINGDVTGSCMLNATKLNKLEQLLQNA